MTAPRPSGRDWLTGLLLGIGIGFAVLGVGGRVAMRGIALLQETTPGLTLGGTTTVVFLGVVSGLAGAIVYLGLRSVLPGRRVLRTMAWWAFLVFVTMRGLRPLDPQRVLVFAPLVLLYGFMLQALWCRLASLHHGRHIALNGQRTPDGIHPTPLVGRR